MRRKPLRWVPLAALAVVAAVVVSGALGASGQKTDLSGKKVGVIICTNQNPFCAAWANSVKSGLEKQGAEVTVLSSVFDPAVGEIYYSAPSNTFAIFYDDLGQSVADPGLVRLGTVDSSTDRIAEAGNRFTVQIYLADHVRF